jgi:type VII secretion protein EccE
MARHGYDGPAEPPRDPPGDATEPGQPGGALYASRSAESDTPTPTSRGGVIGARPPAGTAPQAANAMPPPLSTAVQAPPAKAGSAPPPSATVANLHRGQAAPPAIRVPAPPQTQSAADSTIPRAYVAPAAPAAASQALAAARAPAIARAAPAALAWSKPHYWDAGESAAAVAKPQELSRPGKPRTPHKPVTAWSVHAAQVVAWQVVVITVIIALQQRPALMIALLVGAAVLLAISVLRSNGRWAYQWLGLWLRFVCRRRVSTISAGSSVSELLRPFLRGVRLETIEIDDVERALLCHAGGVSLVLEVTPADTSVVVDSAPTLPPPTVLLPPADEAGPPVAAQLVVQTTPAPGAYRAHGVVARSYQSLAAGMVPARRRSWIALQALRMPADEDADDQELRRALIRAVSRLQRRLRRAGMRANALDRSQLGIDLATLSDAMMTREPRGAQGVRLREHWDSWSAGSHPQVTYRLLEWPDLGTHAGREFFDQLVTMPTVATTVGIAARHVMQPAGRSDLADIELEAALRVTVPLDRPDLATNQLRDLTRRHRVRMQRMDGEHVFGVAASLPLGGFAT